ncbi:hypothetical protein A3H65_02290 [Candidatus Giovannonibacteria bacterium RIFCSPLOWO2_02_FULL_45_14]|uniref:Uncharacterized protein n=1 Tax=Candidatus Giovannonibacteria bacterium RIFCSPLOWO2_12_FULL_44_15 TaxID=1798364 RepID=A0A1F5XYZ3_9BACT|nr:MAG: hypothetical protein A3C75_02285 [Candidatus Giovannonibacteria bacterium RIFCSPHIGHO2_02_FULL_44_31]OGF76034.1 MAG: hypothetical protein A3E62_02215 [Candidatus Giovannonibacteria bacterium RIFCSPHIGHO2_12_FULL_44_29]OGF91282.1 MAG: hypothetical protein A3H65_02290 [Candidatus Giovannonibacteria bacterium RIFCSPLOWO2_02_FULL_45_14]OGF93050.1 MAG: hypothetical protein A3G54_02755 [Candidatus Giovannonibacteria bacterium RIFCSPLOWO2_12_FULL_44_15]
MFKKNSHVWIAILGILAFIFLYSQDSLARAAWQKYRFANLALALNRSDAKLAMGIGNYYFNGPGGYDLDRAEAGFNKAIAIDSKILWGHYQLARIYFVKGEKNKALSEINRELEANPENLRALYVRGLIYGYMDDLRRAEDDFRRFTLWSPEEWAGYNDLAWILAKEGKYDEAVEVLMGALDKVPRAEKNPWIWNSLGVAQLNLKNYSAAKSSFLKAKEAADAMTLKEWQAAYPGNNPTESEKAFLDFKLAIEKNIETSSVDNRLRE